MDKSVGGVLALPQSGSAARDLGAYPTRVLAITLLVLYVVLDWLTYVYPARFGITPFNPEAAVAGVLFMLCGARYAPLVFIAAL